MVKRNSIAKIRVTLAASYRVFDYCGCGYCGCRHEVRQMGLQDEVDYERARLRERAQRASNRRAVRVRLSRLAIS